MRTSCCVDRLHDTVIHLCVKMLSTNKISNNLFKLTLIFKVHNFLSIIIEYLFIMNSIICSINASINVILIYNTMLNVNAQGVCLFNKACYIHLYTLFHDCSSYFICFTAKYI